MLTVGVEPDPRHLQGCMVCPIDAEGIHPELYVVLWENKLPVPQGLSTRTGACLRLCWEHADELCRLLLETL